RLFITTHDPLTTSIAIGNPTPDRTRLLRVVGVVEDIRHKSLMDEAEPTYYVPQAQNVYTFMRPAIVIAAPPGRADGLVAPIRDQLQRFDPQVIVAFTHADAVMRDAMSRQEFGMTLMLIFGVTALTLAAVGIYGVIAYVAAQRTGELATRIALG